MRLLCESVTNQSDNQTLILKMARKEAFIRKPKHKCHLPQWGEWAYDSQSWKEMRLLRESMINQSDNQTLILKKVGREAFLKKPKHQCHLSQWG